MVGDEHVASASGDRENRCILGIYEKIRGKILPPSSNVVRPFRLVVSYKVSGELDSPNIQVINSEFWYYFQEGVASSFSCCGTTECGRCVAPVRGIRPPAFLDREE
jgi:hypothetical protein